jgi:hypothetical protein
MTAPLAGPPPLLDAILEQHRAVLGEHLLPYRNHCARVATFCSALSGAEPDAMERIAIAAAFHDLGIWTDHTFDYLAPSERLATAYLHARGRADLVPEIGAMIREHHKLTPSGADTGWLVEPFRRADLVDVSRGAVRFGLPRALIRAAYQAWPGAGFHRTLVRLAAKRALRHPLNPLPMVRL